MAKRFKSITDPDGLTIDPLSYINSAAIERLDGRNPLFKYYKYRFAIRGIAIRGKFTTWMYTNFGNSMNHGTAMHYAKCGVSLDDVKWVLHYDARSYYNYIYFNKECEVLIRLNFMQGQTL
jgi:hypothetical protein